ncbi:MAG: hypothetical protein ACJ8GN_16990 [Longimicrobiaceae bacterium]
MQTRNLARCAALAALLATPVAASAQIADTLHLEYAVKVVCGRSMTEGAQGQIAPVAMGQYFTAVNVHNPTDRWTPFRIKVAYTRPESQGPITGFTTLWLGPDGALRVDCKRVLTGPPVPPPPFPITAPQDGFLVIQSQVDLDVVAVYTAAPGVTQPVSTMDVERVQPRQARIGWQHGCPPIPPNCL